MRRQDLRLPRHLQLELQLSRASCSQSFLQTIILKALHEPHVRIPVSAGTWPGQLLQRHLQRHERGSGRAADAGSTARATTNPFQQSWRIATSSHSNEAIPCKHTDTNAATASRLTQSTPANRNRASRHRKAAIAHAASRPARQHARTSRRQSSTDLPRTFEFPAAPTWGGDIPSRSSMPLASMSLRALPI